MGCVSSKADINDTHPNLFNVINVNDSGKPVSRGKLEVTPSELIFYQKGKHPTIWPWKSLRKYGLDIQTSIFSIECGRRCPTGEGYYAFKCKKAESLFALVQRTVGAVSNGNIANHSTPDATSITASSITANSQRNGDRPIGNRTVNAEQPVLPSRIQIRPVSVSSTSPISSPSAINEVLPTFEHNNNVRYNAVIENGNNGLNYANINIPESIPGSPPPLYGPHVYMNVDTQEVATTFHQIVIQEESDVNDELHCYANIDSNDVECLELQRLPNGVAFNEVNAIYSNENVPISAATPPSVYEDASDTIAIKEVNYAELDLNSIKNDDEQQSIRIMVQLPPPPPPPPNLTKPQQGKGKKEGYATIDFEKTIALGQLSQNLHQTDDVDEGSRKTRHNSTIESLNG